MGRYFSLWIIVLCCIFVNNINFWDTYCSPYLSSYYYNECIKEENRNKNYNYRFERAKNSEARNDLVDAIYSLEQMKNYAYKELIDKIDSIICDYSNNLWNIYYNKGSYSEAIKYYKKALAIYEDPITLYNIWWAYARIKDYNSSLFYLNKSKQKSLDVSFDKEIDEAISSIKKIQMEEEDKKKWETNDKRWYLQYYLPWINIFNAWDKLPDNKHKVVIAVIDDWVNLNHPDLKDKLRVNKREIDGDWIDNDKNGYIDDYNWWDFTLNTKPTLPSNSHGTMVAGIIAANTDNVIWIAWIVPNVEIMSLKVRMPSSAWAREEEGLDAINYARHNWAHLINFRLGIPQLSYNNKFNPVIKNANDKWVIVIISAWNWDKLSTIIDGRETAGVNTSVNSLSPVCNESNKKMIIWVWALSKNWAQAKRSNYWSCVDFYMYWESIVSTSITFDDNPYEIWTWTSFSAPIVAWIVWLWYNKFWKIKPDIVYDNLKKSLNWNVIDASKYLDNLSISQWDLWKAIWWVINNKFTSAQSIEWFKYNNGITRAEAAKFFVTYAELFNKNKQVNNNDKCKFQDLEKAPLDLRSYMFKSCRYGLLGWSNWKFRPNSKLTNAEAVTIFMRMYGWKKDESWNHFADKYFIEATKLWLIDWMIMWKQKNYEKGATRWDMAILLYRWYNKFEQNRHTF